MKANASEASGPRERRPNASDSTEETVEEETTKAVVVGRTSDGKGEHMLTFNTF
jgi:hypothetical protein